MNPQGVGLGLVISNNLANNLIPHELYDKNKDIYGIKVHN
jgi:hypothetical protein